MKQTAPALALFSLLILIFGFGSISRAASGTGSESVSGASCIDHYNSLLQRAKAALSAGNRSEAVVFLEEARRLLPVCPALQNGAFPQRTMLSLNCACDASAGGSSHSGA